MKGLSRRHFIVRSAVGTVGVYPRHGYVRTVSTNDRVAVAVVGLRGMGRGHVDRLLKAPGAVCVALCDIDQSMLDREHKKVFQATGKSPRNVKDFRHILDDTSVDAVVVATPHHWHVHIAVQALCAGKDVYLEKPGSHVFREGRLLVAVAEETNRIVQHGTQMRSSQVMVRAREVPDSGVIGEIKMAKAWNLQQHRHKEACPRRSRALWCRLRHVVGAGSPSALQPQSLPRKLELVSGLWQRRHRRGRGPRPGSSPLWIESGDPSSADYGAWQQHSPGGS